MKPKLFLPILMASTLFIFSSLHANETSARSERSERMDPKKEYTRKGEILKQLVGVIGWPAGVLPKDSINLCVLGELPYAQPIQALKGSVAHQHKIKVKFLSDFKHAENACHILYIAESETLFQKQIINSLAQKPILLVGDMNNFARNGGSMNFVTLNDEIALTVNLPSLKQANLTIDLKTFKDISILPDAKDIAD